MTLRAEGLGLTLRRPGATPVPLLAGIEFRLGCGEILGIAGRSGAGKSLVAEALVGLVPEHGERRGRILVGEAPPGPREIALAPQRVDALDPLAPVGRQIARLSPRGTREAPGDFLARVGLSPTLAGAYPHTLSGGMARRALLATALATGARWIVVDEPTVGLDGAAADRILALLAGLAREGRGLVVVSHDLVRLARLAGRILLLDGGRAAETADAEDFAGDGARLATAFARALWRAQIPESPC